MALVTATPAQAGVPYDAGDYIPAKPGTNLVLLYGQTSSATGLYDGGHEIDSKAKLTSDLTILRIVHFSQVADMPFNVQILQPYGRVRTTAGNASTQSSGLGDMTLVATVWPVNDTRRGHYLGMTAFLYLPTGDYRAHRATNIGENRFKGVFQLGYSHRISKQFVAELGADVTFYGRNPNLRGMVLRQMPRFSVQAHARYLLGEANEFNIRAMYSRGMRGDFQGQPQDLDPGSLSLLAGVRHTVSPTLQIMLEGGRDVFIRNGYKEGARGQIRLLFTL
ncbi:MAG TPA: transporter [Sphingobium sp.]|uniref:transporter n=1 Tax=Sphingobium sp. TaxID=1912891 RepID=UPI002ED0B676